MKSEARASDSFKVFQKELNEICGFPIGSLRPFVSAPHSSIHLGICGLDQPMTKKFSFFFYSPSSGIGSSLPSSSFREYGSGIAQPAPG